VRRRARLCLEPSMEQGHSWQTPGRDAGATGRSALEATATGQMLDNMLEPSFTAATLYDHSESWSPAIRQACGVADPSHEGPLQPQRGICCCCNTYLVSRSSSIMGSGGWRVAYQLDSSLPLREGRPLLLLLLPLLLLLLLRGLRWRPVLGSPNMRNLMAESSSRVRRGC
jgi:hypothetical protein